VYLNESAAKPLNYFTQAFSSFSITGIIAAREVSAGACPVERLSFVNELSVRSVCFSFLLSQEALNKKAVKSSVGKNRRIGGWFWRK